jgi:hypothetical protein
MTIEELIEHAHRTAIEKGWWDDGWEGTRTPPKADQPGRGRSLGDQFANFHAELSEAWEVYRAGAPLDRVWFDEHGKPEGFVVELADVWIRIADTLGAYGLAEAFEAALEHKLAYNETRPHRHGGKLA